MSIKEKQQELIDDFAFLSDWEQKYEYIIALGKELKGLPEEKKKEEVKENFQKFISEVDIDKLFNERESYINGVIANKEYEKAIMLYNNKGLHTVIEKYFNMGDYRHKALDYLRRTKEIEPIKRVFPDQLWNGD